MKIKIKRILAAACVLASLCGMLAGCGEIQYEVSSYQGQLTDGQTKSDYNKALFYRNDKKAKKKLLKNMKNILMF